MSTKGRQRRKTARAKKQRANEWSDSGDNDDMLYDGGQPVEYEDMEAWAGGGTSGRARGSVGGGRARIKEEDGSEEWSLQAEGGEGGGGRGDGRGSGQRDAAAHSFVHRQGLHTFRSLPAKWQAESALTWIQCENKACGKWRRVKAAEVPEGPWFCADNSLPT